MSVVIKGRLAQGLEMIMEHMPSGKKLATDPPVDNGGAGASFSPTDLIATGLGSCMMTVMALAAKKEALDLSGMSCSVTKHMSDNLPRRIVRLDVDLNLPERLSADQRSKYEGIAFNCPVIHSLNPQIEIRKQVRFS